MAIFLFYLYIICSAFWLVVSVRRFFIFRSRLISSGFIRGRNVDL